MKTALPADIFAAQENRGLPVATYESLFDYSRFPSTNSIINPELKIRTGYNHEFPQHYSDLDIEMWSAGQRLSIELGGLGEFGHLKRCLQLLFPYLVDEWHHWLDMQVSMFCGTHGTNVMLGAGGTGKSWVLGTMARIWQACRPVERGVLVLNTTQETQAERAWKYIITLGQLFPFLPGRVVGGKSPKLEIMVPTENIYSTNKIYKAVPGVGIISQTMKKGTSAAATADMKGFHPRELLVVVEEANHYVRTFLERARANWITNQVALILLTGNPSVEDSIDNPNNEDALRHFSMPLHGWDSIEWGKDRFWSNKFGGMTYHLDAYDSPRVHNPEKYRLSTWLPDDAYIEQKIVELGGSNTPLFKQQIRGIYDHDSLPFTLISRTMFTRFEGGRPAKFLGMNRRRYAAFDPAYSGVDEAFLKIAETGITDSGKEEIDFLGTRTNFSFKITSDSAIEPSFQMLYWVQEKLQEWKVPYENFIMDANAIGIGLGDIFSSFLSKEITKVKVHGAATDRLLDLTDQSKANDRCVNKQAEMWLAAQLLLIAGQLRGIDESVIRQLVDMPAELSKGKVQVLTKKEFKRRFGYSPDRAETVLFIIDLLRDRGFKQQNTSEELIIGSMEDRMISLDGMFDSSNAPVPYTERLTKSPWGY